MLKRFFLIVAMLMTMAALPRPLVAADVPVEATKAAVEAHGTEDQRPLLDFRPAEAIWVIVIFAILLAILYPTAWKNVLAGLKAREERIRKDISDAEEARKKAEATLKQYAAQLADAENKVRDMLTKAGVDAEKIAANVRLRSQQEAEEIKERANKEIETAKNAALTEIYEKTADLATSVAEKIIRRSLRAEDQRDLVDQSLRQLEELGKR